MNRKISLAGLIVFFVASIFLGNSTNAAADGAQKTIDWNDDSLEWFSYEDGIKKIEESGKSGLLVIYADWCPACQKHSKDFFDKKIVSLLKDMILIRVNRDTGEEISKQYDFDGQYIPRVIALGGDAEVIHELYDLDQQYAYFDPTRSMRKFEELVVNAMKYSQP